MADYTDTADDAPRGEHAELTRKLKAWYAEDIKHVSEWRGVAREDYEFYNGEQWSQEDMQVLREQKRPALTFNRIGPLVNAVVGSEINNRREVQYIPREQGDAEANEILTAAGEWFRDQTGAEDEESDAFEDATICGMGWCLSDDAMVRIPNAHFATTRLFSGNVIKIDLENGQNLTGTPNHPVLTDMGWKRLCDLKEGDNLINSAFLERVEGFPVEQFDKVETRLKDKVDAFRAGREAGRFVTAPDDFYSDGAGSKVHVVYADSALLNKFRHAASRQAVPNNSLVRGHALPGESIGLLGYGLLHRSVFATKHDAPVYLAHSPSLHVTCSNIIAKLVSSLSKASGYAIGAFQPYTGGYLAGGHGFIEVKTPQLLNRNIGSSSRSGVLPGAKSVARPHKPGGNTPTAYSKFISDFFDWKPILEIQLRKLFGRDGIPSEFMTRVERRIVERVVDFPVHDIGTSLGMFIAGNVITSNTDTRLDFEDDPDGAPQIRRLDPLKMAWDCNASKPNLEDAQRLWYVDEKPYSEVKEMFPDVAKELLNAGWAKTLGNDPTQPHDQDQADLYAGGQNEFASSSSKKMCTLVECRWFEKVPYYRGPDFETGQPKEYSEKQIELIRKQVPEFPAVRQYRKVVKRAFIGAEVLAAPDQPLVPPGMFGWECITGYRDKLKRTFYGIVRPAKDPQRWSNKFFSQTQFLLNSQSKGGILAERGIADDDRQFEESWAKTESITWAKAGSLSGQAPKFVAKPTAQFPSGFFTLFNESKEAISQVTGLSPEFIGTREVDQAGVLEYQRRQSSLNLLASLFNSLRRYRKRQGKTMLFLIQNHLSDGRLVRIVGDDKAQYVPLTKDAVSNSQYDIIVDDAPTSPNEKDRTWQIISQMLPMLKDFMTPEIGLEILKYSPLPASMVSKWQRKAKEAADQAAQQPKPPTPEEQQMAMNQQNFQMEMAGKEADLQAKQTENQMDVAMKGVDLFVKQREAEIDGAVGVMKLQQGAQRISIQEQQNAVRAQNANSRRTSSAE